MQFHPIHIVAFFTLALVASHAALAPEQYWNSVLPNTPMPKAISDLLPGVNVGRKAVGVNTGKPGKRTNVGVARGDRTRLIGVRRGDRTRLNVNYAASTENELQDDPNVVIFFLEKNMHPGTTMNLHFNEENTNKATIFLPRLVANSIPFSSNKLPEIFNHFSVKPGSVEAEIMEDTIKECESSGIKGEDKYCATSLESMIDFSTSKLGKNIQAISTEVEGQTQFQKYKITAGVTKMRGDNSVVCHKQNYAYAVFDCHATQTAINTYTVPLEGADGKKANAVAVCHKDTSAWNPKHLAFKVLKVTPGTVPICYFLPDQDHIVWVPK